jgi:hypothetical protein
LPRAALAAGILLVAAAIGAGGALLLDGGDGDVAAVEEVPVPPVPDGAQALGGDLAAPDRALDCRGKPATPDSPTCAIVQSDLGDADATLLAPADGVIVGWAVRGASGDLVLDVIRPRGTDTLRPVRSQWEYAGNAAPHYFKTRLPVEQGDQVGIELGTGASIGVSDAAGATTERWRKPSGGAYGAPDLEAGTGFDYELALRVDFIAGDRVPAPPRLTGDAAAKAPDGFVRASQPLKVDDPDPIQLRVDLVEIGPEVALDVFRGDVRTQRIFIPDLRSLGVPVTLEAFRYPGEAFGEVGVYWVNPSSGKSIFHDYILGEGAVELVQ